MILPDRSKCYKCEHYHQGNCVPPHDFDPHDCSNFQSVYQVPKFTDHKSTCPYCKAQIIFPYVMEGKGNLPLQYKCRECGHYYSLRESFLQANFNPSKR